MWFLFLMMVLNAGLHNRGELLELRYSVGGLPINILDFLQFFGVLCVLLGPTFGARRFHTDRLHPLMVASLVLFAVTIAAGSIVGAANGAASGSTLYYYLAEMRNVASFPMAMACGYYFLKTPASNVRFAYVAVVAGIASATLILVYFVGKSSVLTTGQLVDSVRAIDYVSYYAGLAGALLMYTIFNRDARLLPVVIALPVMGYCFIGQFATLSRSDWLSAAAAVGVVPFLLPKEKMATRWGAMAIGLPAAACAVVLGLVVLSSMTGRNLTEALGRRLQTVLPFQRGDDSYLSGKAWDTRVPGMIKEFQLWTQSPLYGHGFGYTFADNLVGVDDVSFYHNVWVAQSAAEGLIGFAAYATPVIGMLVIGRRMVRQSIDRGSTLMGVIACSTGAYSVIIGASTMSFNIQRGALCMGLIAGAVLRARMMQLAVLKQYEGYIDANDPQGYYVGDDEAALLPAT
jgi:hypothetical protein